MVRSFDFVGNAVTKLAVTSYGNSNTGSLKDGLIIFRTIRKYFIIKTDEKDDISVHYP